MEEIIALREDEIIILTNAEWSADEIGKIVSRVQETLAKHSGTVLQIVDLGKRSTAYEIKKVQRANFLCCQYAADETLVKELERWLRLEDGILKYMTVQRAEEIDVTARQGDLPAMLKKLEENFGTVAVLAGGVAKEAMAS